MRAGIAYINYTQKLKIFNILNFRGIVYVLRQEHSCEMAQQKTVNDWVWPFGHYSVQELLWFHCGPTAVLFWCFTVSRPHSRAILTTSRPYRSLGTRRRLWGEQWCQRDARVPEEDPEGRHCWGWGLFVEPVEELTYLRQSGAKNSRLNAGVNVSGIGT